MTVEKLVLYYGVCDICGEVAEESRNEEDNAVTDSEIMTQEHIDWWNDKETSYGSSDPHSW
jgi:hypothetical protein